MAALEGTCTGRRHPIAANATSTPDEVQASCEALAAATRGGSALTSIGQSRAGRPIALVTLGDRSGNPDNQPAFWLDGGTHAVEWSGVMAVLAALWRWAEALDGGDPVLVEAFAHHTVYAVPCISPDGLQETMHGAPSFRSTLRPPRPGTLRSGFEAANVDGDGQIVWMRWRHPGGSWVPDGPIGMRPRTVDDEPSTAFFLADEGRFVGLGRPPVGRCPAPPRARPEPELPGRLDPVLDVRDGLGGLPGQRAREPRPAGGGHRAVRRSPRR